MPALPPLSPVPRRLLRRALALSSLALCSFSLLSLASTAHAEDTPPASIPESQAAVAAPASPPPVPLVVATDSPPQAPPSPLVVAVAPAPKLVTTEPEPEPSYVFLFRVDAGLVVIPGHPAGGFGGFGFDTLFNTDPHRLKLIWGVGSGWEFYGLGGGGGGDYNIEVLGGLKSTRFIAAVSAGVNLFSFDKIDHQGGGGILSPRAGARFGLFTGKYYLSAIAEVQRRWQWGREDITMFTAGLLLGGGGEDRDRK